MAEMTTTGPRLGLRTKEVPSDEATQARRLLHFAYVLAPTVAGLDKFFHLLGDWNQYLAPQVERMLPISGVAFMRLAGIIEVAVGLLVAARPKIGAYVVAAWLAGIVLNLVLQGRYLDVALRDVGLMFGALALARLSATDEARTATVRR
jgi:hypothetical protein